MSNLHKLTCSFCKEQFWYKRRKKFCSVKCRGRSYKVTGKTREELIEETKKKNTCICEVCNKSYVNKRGPKPNEGSRFCSMACSDKYLSNRYCEVPRYSLVHKHKCVNCGINFLAKSRLAKTCSHKCKRAVINKRKSLSRGAVTVKCVSCNIMFSRVYPNKKRTCSDECSNECERKSARKEQSLRRSRIRGNDYIIVDPIDILSRDGWTCQACGCDTPRSLRGSTDDCAPELDHVIPVSKGGAHKPYNLQCLCRTCNQLKSDMSMEYFVSWLGSGKQATMSA